MRIIVLLKQVPETSTVKMDEKTGTMIREGVEAILNPLDLYAVETALRLRETLPAGACETLGISMGPPKAVQALREAVAMGLDSALLLSDKAFAGSDTWATSCVLAAAVRKLGGADLILCGERATDGDTGQVGPGVASFLDWPVATYVARLELLDATATPPACRVHRLVENGREVLEMDLPAVVTVVKEIASPRLPTLRGKQKAQTLAIPVWGAKDLDVSEENLGLNGSPTRVRNIFRPKVARECEKLVVTDADSLHRAADRVVEFLREKELL